MDQQPDSRPGHYYVSVVRSGTDWRPLLGPFEQHAAALARVDKARAKALELDPKAPWYSYGTVRAEHYAGAGILNRLLPELAPTAAEGGPNWSL